MADRGEREFHVDVAVFADTGWEPQAVYEHLEWLKQQVSIPIVTVSAGNILDDARHSFVGGGSKGRYASMPLFVNNADRKGMLKRQCTREYKIDPIKRWIKTEVLDLPVGARWPTSPAITQIFGISMDEYHRMRRSEPWAVFEYPLVTWRWHRSKAVEWAECNYPDRVFPRSACCGCPFHSDKEWQHLKDTDAQGWESAVELDKTIRHADKMHGEVFLHRSCQPLEQVDFERKTRGQLTLWQDECTGMCGT